MSMNAYQDAGVEVESNSFRRSRIVSKQNSRRYQNSSMNSEENEFLRGYDVNPGRNNSFSIPTPPSSNYKTLNVSKMTERQLSPTAIRQKSTIEELQEKNAMLKKEVDRVQKILNMGDRHKIKKLPQIDGNVLRKQLQNAYKQINFYEKEIEYREKLYQHQGSYVQKIRKAEQTVSERKDIVRKLTAEISQSKKQSNQYVKLLQDGHIKKQYANETSRLHKEIKVYEKKVKEEEELAISEYNTAQIKSKRIFQMEEQLIRNGHCDKTTLYNMRKKLLNKERPKSTIQKEEQYQDISEDRSKKAFESLKGEMLTLKKMQKDYAKKIGQLESEKEQAEYKSMQTKYRLEQLEKQLISMEEAFQQAKKKVDPDKLKPLIKKGTFSESNTSQIGNKKGKGNPLEHQFDVSQVGNYRKKATVVNDRLVIGKKSAYIVELTLYENRVQFLGFQASYQIGQGIKKGANNVLMRQNERFLKEKTVKLQPGDYFRNIECTLNQSDIIIGMIAVSMQGKTVKAGAFQGFSSQLQTKNREYPCCLYGAYTTDGFELMGIEKVEPAD